jgi:multimeric flavodoxin WrbA
VVTLIANMRQRPTFDSISAFATPTVVHLASALLVSAIMSVPWPSLFQAWIALAMCGIGGLAYGAVVIRRARRQTYYKPDWEDWLWYALLPCSVYAALMMTALFLRRWTIMKAIAINGSPRPGGNTEIMLKKVLEPLEAAGWSTQYLRIGGKPVRGCIACMKCFEKRNGWCAVEKDDMNDYLEKIYAADAVILGSPTYFADVTPELKALIDRAGFVALANGGMLRGKIGAAVVAVRRGGATHVFDTINHMFLLSSMIVPGSIYWNLGVGRDKGEVLGDDEAMRNMSHLGQTIAWPERAIASVPDAFPIPPYNVEVGELPEEVSA